MKVIGITGGIGSGKSTVAKFLAEMGAVILDADRLGHEVLRDSDVWQQVVTVFGKGIIAADGSIDRRKLGEIVFNDAAARDKLNRITHPRIGEMTRSRLEEYRRQGIKAVVLEIPLLVEAGGTNLVDEVWVTVAPEAVVISRLRGRNGLSEAESRARIQSQISSPERIKHADVVIDTNCTLDELKAKVAEHWQRLQA